MRGLVDRGWRPNTERVHDLKSFFWSGSRFRPGQTGGERAPVAAPKAGIRHVIFHFALVFISNLTGHADDLRLGEAG